MKRKLIKHGLKLALAIACMATSAFGQGVARFANFLPQQGVFAVAQPSGLLTGEEQMVGQLFLGGTGPGFTDATAVGQPVSLTLNPQAGGFTIDTLVTLAGVSSGESFSGRAVYWDARFGSAAETFDAVIGGAPALMGVTGASGIAGTEAAPGLVELAPVVLLPGALIPEPNPLALGALGLVSFAFLGRRGVKKAISL